MPTMPAGITTVTVTGRYIHPDGTPFSGKVTFSAPSLLQLAGADTIAFGSAVFTLDTNGTFTAILVATDNANMQPTEWKYQVTEQLTGVSPRTYWIDLPSTPSPVDLADIAPADPARGSYVLVPGPVGLPGADGNTILSGHGAPANSTGRDGDYWMDLDATTLYGPKASGSWPGSGVSLVGGGSLITSINGLSGGTVTSPVRINGAPGTVDPALPAGYGASATQTGLSLGSTYPSDDVAGGTDGTSRINLYSYQRSNVNSFGEVVRVFNMRKDAKSMLAWYMPSNAFAADRTPNAGNWKPVTWIGSHWEANSHAGNHKHWEIEIPDSTGALQGRLEILFGNQADDTIGLDKTNTITNLTDFTIRCHGSTPGGADIQQALRLSAAAGFEKPIEWSNDTDGVGKRWKLRATSETESGSNAGTNMQLVRYDDTGTLIDVPLQVNRATGQVTVGGTGGTSSGLAVFRNATGAVASITSLAASGSAVLATLVDTASSAFQTQVSADTVSRYRLFADGKQEWGTGSATRDTNLYRSSVGVLKTDGSLSVTQNLRINTTSTGSGVGVIAIADATTDPAGTPTGGGVLHSKNGLPWWKGSDGVDYDLAHGQYPVTFIRKTADETVTSSVTVQDDDQLTAAVAANSVYLVEAFILYDGDTTGDFRLTFTGPAGASMDWTPNGLATSQATGTGSMKLDRLPLGTEETLGASGAGVKAVALPRGILTVGATPGNLTLRWAQATSSATATTVFANSWIRVTKVA
jgi:hypothetical protein